MKKRLIVTSVISIILVAILMIGSTYSVFTTSDVDEDVNVYRTGNLDISYILSEDNVQITDVTPMSNDEASTVIPYRITITNSGTVPYQFDLILNDTTAGEVIDYHYIMTKVGYLEPKSLIECTDNIIKDDVIVPANSSVDVDVRVWISDKVSNDEIGKSFYAKLSIDGLAIYDDSTEIDNSLLALNYMVGFTGASDFSYFKSDTYRESIKSVSFVDYIDITNAVEQWDMSVDEDESIIAWVENNETSGYYNLYIGSKRKIYAKDLTGFFGLMIGIENFSFANLDTSLTTNMEALFVSNETSMSITTLDLSSFKTKNVTSMRIMFSNCQNLTNLDLSSFDTSNVTDMTGMFQNCISLVSLDLKNFDTSNVTSMYGMFQGSSGMVMNLISLNISSFDTSSVTNMRTMFQNCRKLLEIDLTHFNTSNVTNMRGMFYNCISLTSLDLSSFDTSNVTNMYGMFACTDGVGVMSLTSLDLSSFDTSNVTDMTGMFKNCIILVSLDLKNFDTSKVISMMGMFYNCSSLTSLDLSNFNTSNVTDMSYMFYNGYKLTTSITIKNTGTTTYESMFENAATNTGATITVNYTSDTSDLVDSMIGTKSDTSNVLKGSQV